MNGHNLRPYVLPGDAWEAGFELTGIEDAILRVEELGDRQICPVVLTFYDAASEQWQLEGETHRLTRVDS